MYSGTATKLMIAANPTPTSHDTAHERVIPSDFMANVVSAVTAIPAPIWTGVFHQSTVTTANCMSHASSTIVGIASSEWVPWRCPPTIPEIALAPILPNTGMELAMVAEGWSASGSSAAPAHTSAPTVMPSGSSSRIMRLPGTRVAVASQTAAPDMAWEPPIMIVACPL